MRSTVVRPTAFGVTATAVGYAAALADQGTPMADTVKKVVLAYSGGLDTSVAVRWMIENLGVEVVCLSADVGQEGTLDGNREKALGAGASEYIELDLREEFARDYLAPVIKAKPLPITNGVRSDEKSRPLPMASILSNSAAWIFS